MSFLVCFDPGHFLLWLLSMSYLPCEPSHHTLTSMANWHLWNWTETKPCLPSGTLVMAVRTDNLQKRKAPWGRRTWVKAGEPEAQEVRTPHSEKTPKVRTQSPQSCVSSNHTARLMAYASGYLINHYFPGIFSLLCICTCLSRRVHMYAYVVNSVFIILYICFWR